MRILSIALLCLFPLSTSLHAIQTEIEDPQEDHELLIPQNAIETTLVRIISEPENGMVHKINLILKANGEILQIVRQSENSTQAFTPQQLIEGEVVLAKVEGRKAVTLSCRDCTVENGGILKLGYLFNGVMMLYRSLSMQLKRDGNSWKLFTMDQRPIRRLKLVSRIIFGRLIGIKQIDVL